MRDLPLSLVVVVVVVAAAAAAAADLRVSVVVHCVSKNDTDVAHYNFDTDQPILLIFGRDVADRVCYQTMICYPILVTALPGKHEPPKLCLSSHAV